MTATFLPAPAFAIDDPQRLAKTDLTRCMLLMNAGNDQLGYAVFDPREQSFIMLKDYYFDTGDGGPSFLEVLEQCFDQDKILFTAFDQVRISFDTPGFTLVPSGLFDPALKRDYFSLLYPPARGRLLFTDRIDPPDVMNIYAVDKDVAGYLKKEFGSARFFHAETAFLTSLLKQQDPGGNRVYMRILPGRIVITVLADGRLLMMQPYAIHDIRDALYHVLNAVGQLDLALENTRVFLSGDVEEDSPLYRELAGEIPGVSWLKRPAAFHYVPAFGAYPDHHFYNLLSLALCG